LAESIAAAQRESQSAFGDGRVFLEKYIESAHHVEFQILADSHDHTVHLFERECSIQRRHQKIIEESPSPLLEPDLRQRMGATAIAAAKAVGYVNAGTVEFIVDSSRDFYFLEMNTRLQVEHPVTEWVTGVDLVAQQINIAAGDPLPFTQADLVQHGHAIECRIYAEDPTNDFFPSAGTITRLIEPSGPGVRIDAGATAGDEISIHYDPLIAKLSVHGADRGEAIARLRQALAEYQIDGLTTNLAFLRAVIANTSFVAGDTTTSFIADHLAGWKPLPSPPTSPPLRGGGESAKLPPWERADGFRLGGGVTYEIRSLDAPVESRTTRRAENTLTATMPGQVTHVFVAPGDSVTHGQTLATLEAMKMELRLTAPRDGLVRAVRCEPGQVVTRGQVLIELE
jgi:acetyl/propionyl-CoA carboxylase alpha subunit